MKIAINILTKIALIVSLLTIFAIMGAIGAYLYSEPQVPSIESLKNVKLQTPMRIFTKDRKLIGEFGDVRRTPVTLDEVPINFINALIATEDQRFRDHSGVDIKGLLRVLKVAVTTGEFSEGASTLTMQTARNMFLSRDKTLRRKLIEMFLAIRMERELSKDEILELYTNKVHFSHRAYGLGAAAQVYYGKDLGELDLPQAAMMAGLLKGESSYNPISNPERALKRRNEVLRKMQSNKDQNGDSYITEEQYQQAVNTPLTAKKHTAELDLDAPYLAEMVRLKIIEQFGREQAYTQGLEITTTINSKHQQAANDALHKGLISYDKRHGYKGPELLIENFDPSNIQSIITLLQNTPSHGGLIPAVVTEVTEQSIKVIKPDGKLVEIQWTGLEWAKPFIDDSKVGDAPKTASDILKVGSLIRILKSNVKIDKDKSDSNSEWTLTQIPEASAGFVSLQPKNGGITALVGGFDYLSNKFNLVTQARRQPGSNIKPFIYAAALNKGFTPASLVNDAPFIKVNKAIDEVWRPQNDNLKYSGPTRLRTGLKRSINTISTRLIDAIGADYAEKYLVQIGLPDEHMDPFQSLALGTASFTPLEMAMAYAVLANGGYQVDPYYIEAVHSSVGDVLFEANPTLVCKECEQLKIRKLLNANKPQPEIRNYPELPVDEDKIALQVMDPRDAFIIYDMMKDVIHSGTATTTLARRKSNLLKRQDLAGKTGTANDYKDAWFSGYNSELVASSWVGFSDHRRSLGKFEYGGKAALPIWADFMEQVLLNTAEKAIVQPPGVVRAKIDPLTGKLAAIGQTDSIFEYFRDDNVPTEVAEIETDYDDIYNESGIDDLIDGLEGDLDKATRKENDDSEEEPEEDSIF